MAETTPPPIIIEDDDLCPVCQLLLFTPVRTKCNHLLCSSCFAQWADISSATNIVHSSLDVNFSDFGPSYDPAYDLEANCPMCRTHTAAAPDTKLARQLEKKYPTTYAERKEEEEIERGSKSGENGVEGVMILIGNKHRIARDADDANVHDWTFFVRTSRPEIVEEVRINLHSTFRPPRVVRRQPPFEVHRRGWGIFEIQAEIVLKEPYSWVKDHTETRHPGLKLAWTLDFEGRGRQGRLRTKVRKLATHTVEAAQDQGRATSPVNWPHMDQDDYE